MTMNNINATLTTTLSNTLNSLYAQAAKGDKVPAAKLHAIWMVGAEIPNDFAAIPEVTPASRRMRGRILALLVTVYISLDRDMLSSGRHVEPTHSRIARWAESEEKRIRRERMAHDTDGLENLAVLFNDSEAFIASDCCDFEAGQLIADSHGYKVVDDSNLDKLETQAERAHIMATTADLLADGCSLNRSGKLEHGGMDFSDAVRAEIGPWTYEFTTEDGEVVRLGYQGPAGQPTCPKCDGKFDHEGDCVDCGFNPRWDDEHTAWAEYIDNEERIENGYLADERRERGDRFALEFERAASCPADRLVKEYRAAWTRYRARHLAIGRALIHAPKGHGLWGHVWLSKQQWAVIEAAYAARARRTTVDKYGRPAIARERLRKEEVIRWADLAYSLL